MPPSRRLPSVLQADRPLFPRGGRRRALLLLLVALLVVLAVRSAQAAPAPFSLAEAGPAFQGTPAAAAPGLMRADDWKGAAALLEPARKLKKLDGGLVQFALGYVYFQLGRHKDAVKAFDLAQSSPLLAPYAAYYGARAAFHAKDYKGAAERAAKVDGTQPIANEALLVEDDALYIQKAWQPLAALSADILKQFPSSIRLTTVRARLAESIRKRKGPVSAEVPLLRAIYLEDPTSQAAKDALARLTKLGSPAYLVFDAHELATRAHALFDAMRNADSEAAFLEVLKQPKLAPDVECDARFHLAQSVFKQRERPRAAPLFDQAATACAKTNDVELAMKAAYQAGRTHASAGDFEGAIKLFLAAEAAYPKHSYADDARLRAAESAAQLPKSDAQVTELLSSIPTRYPQGDMAGEALWRLAFRAWQAGKWQEALGWLDKQIAAVPHEMRWDAEGQAFYWKARVLEKLGKKAEAEAAYKLCVTTYPLSVYTWMTLNRVSPELKKSLIEAAKTAPAAAPASPAAPTTFAARPEFGDPRFQRALVLLSLGLDGDAARELSAAGFRAPEKGKTPTADEAELLWVAALLYDRAGVWSQSHWIMRKTLTDYKLAWPVGDNKLRWRIAYPLGYSDLVAVQATALGHPVDLAQAIMREESAFNPEQESFANAIGLMQMIIPTATRFAKGTGIEPTRENLKDPQKNVIIGSHFLNFLWQHFGGNAGLVVAGYNAGEGKVDQWLKVRGDLELDEFIETIPYDETRGYAKRVLNSFFIYRWLAWLEGAGGDPVPALTFKLK